jgi:hypothetical protein
MHTGKGEGGYGGDDLTNNNAKFIPLFKKMVF